LIPALTAIPRASLCSISTNRITKTRKYEKRPASSRLGPDASKGERVSTFLLQFLQALHGFRQGATPADPVPHGLVFAFLMTLGDLTQALDFFVTTAFSQPIARCAGIVDTDAVQSEQTDDQNDPKYSR
jgi:hypothetical protein